MSTSLHDTDLVAWAQQSATLLRVGAELDTEYRDQIADELEDMAKATRREMRTRTISLMMHMLKIEFQPELRTRSWDLTVMNQRRELEAVLDESPSLHRVLSDEFFKLYGHARRAAEVEIGLEHFPELNPFTLDQILHG